jgi:hypothetical protein
MRWSSQPLATSKLEPVPWAKTMSLDDDAATVSDVSRRLVRGGGADCGRNLGLSEVSAAFSAWAQQITANNCEVLNDTSPTRLQSTSFGDDCNDVDRFMDRQDMTFCATEVWSRILEMKAFLSWSVTRIDMINLGNYRQQKFIDVIIEIGFPKTLPLLWISNPTQLEKVIFVIIILISHLGGSSRCDFLPKRYVLSCILR